jgi:hypothetical protein
VVDDNDPLHAFGYTAPGGTRVDTAGCWASEGKHGATLEPVVLLHFRLASTGKDVFTTVTPDMADRLAEQLHHFAQRARDKHFRAH